MNISTENRDILRGFVLVAIIGAIMAIPSLANGFVYDDVWIVERNDVVHSLDWGRLFTSTYWPEGRGPVFWRPAAIVGFAVQWALGGGSPWIFHALNVLMYSVLCGLTGLLFTRLFDAKLGMIAGVLFAVHPVHVEVFANVVGQAELWGSLGFVGALLSTWERSGARSPRSRTVWLCVALAFLTIGLGGKEQPVTFPGAVLVLWWLRARRENTTVRAIGVREWIVPAVSFLVIAGYLLLRFHFGGGITSVGTIATGLDRESVLSRIVVMLPVTLTWFRVLFVPLELSADYSPLHLVPEAVFGANHVIAILLWTCLLALALLVRETARSVFVGVALFVITASVVSNIVVPLEVLMAERLLFLPSLGWALAVAGTAVAGYQRIELRSRQKVFAVVGALCALLFAARSVERATVWRSNDVFFANMVADAPESFRSHWAVGYFAFERGDSVTGEREWIEAVRINPRHRQLLEDFGRLYAVTGRYEPSIPLLNQAVALDSTRLAAALQLAQALSRTGRSDEAIDVLDKMMGIHGGVRGLLMVRSEALMRMGEFENALSVLLDLIQQEPEHLAMRRMAVEAALQAGKCEIALAQADTAIDMAADAERAAIAAFRAALANGNANCK